MASCNVDVEHGASRDIYSGEGALIAFNLSDVVLPRTGAVECSMKRSSKFFYFEDVDVHLTLSPPHNSPQPPNVVFTPPTTPEGSDSDDDEFKSLVSKKDSDVFIRDPAELFAASSRFEEDIARMSRSSPTTSMKLKISATGDRVQETVGMSRDLTLSSASSFVRRCSTNHSSKYWLLFLHCALAGCSF